MSLSVYVIQAIKFFREPNGSTVSDITKFIKTNYLECDDDGGDLKARVRNALKLNMKDGVIISRARRYSLTIPVSLSSDYGPKRKCAVKRKVRLMRHKKRNSKCGRKKARASSKRRSKIRRGAPKTRRKVKKQML